MNRKGFTLVEVLAAGAVFLIMIAAFSLLLKEAPGRLSSAKKISRALCEARSKMEALSQGSAGGEIEIIQVEVEWDPRHPPVRLYSLRSRY